MRTSQCQLSKSSPDRLSRLLLELLNLVLQFLVPVTVVRYLLRMVLLLLQASPRSSLFKPKPIKEVEFITSGLSHSYGRQLRLLLLMLHQQLSTKDFTLDSSTSGMDSDSKQMSWPRSTKPNKQRQLSKIKSMAMKSTEFLKTMRKLLMKSQLMMVTLKESVMREAQLTCEFTFIYVAKL